MKYLLNVSVFSMTSWQIDTKDLVTTPKRQIAIIIMAIFMPFSVNANVTCKGRFVNPISDICWSCLMPISIGGFGIGKGESPKKRDTKTLQARFACAPKVTLRFRGYQLVFGSRYGLLILRERHFA